MLFPAVQVQVLAQRGAGLVQVGQQFATAAVHVLRHRAADVLAHALAQAVVGVAGQRQVAEDRGLVLSLAFPADDSPFRGLDQPVVAVVAVQPPGAVAGQLLGGITVGIAAVGPAGLAGQTVAGRFIAVAGGLAVCDQLAAVAVPVVVVVPAAEQAAGNIQTAQRIVAPGGQDDRRRCAGSGSPEHRTGRK